MRLRHGTASRKQILRNSYVAGNRLFPIHGVTLRKRLTTTCHALRAVRNALGRATTAAAAPVMWPRTWAATVIIPRPGQSPPRCSLASRWSSCRSSRGAFVPGPAAEKLLPTGNWGHSHPARRSHFPHEYCVRQATQAEWVAGQAARTLPLSPRPGLPLGGSALPEKEVRWPPWHLEATAPGVPDCEGRRVTSRTGSSGGGGGYGRSAAGAAAWWCRSCRCPQASWPLPAAG